MLNSVTKKKRRKIDLSQEKCVDKIIRNNKARTNSYAENDEEINKENVRQERKHDLNPFL